MKRFKYYATIERVIDGDTIDVKIDHGFHLYSVKRLRLSDVDTPEIRGEERKEGLEIKEFVTDLLKDKELIVYTKKDRTGRYGRYIAEVHFVNDEGNFVCLNDILKEKGYGKEY